MPKTEDLFGQLSDGKLILKGSLFKICCASDRRRSLKWKGQFHLDYESPEFLEETIYFLPLAEVRVRNRERAFTGIYLYETRESQNRSVPTYVRIGDCGIMDGGGDGFMLDSPSWARLLKVSSLEEFGKELMII